MALHAADIPDAGSHQTRIPKADMSTQEWLNFRKNTGVFASEIATVAGLNPYMTPQALHYQKLGVIPPDDLSDKAAVRWGILLEPVVAAEYERVTGRRVRQCNFVLIHPKYPFIGCNLDRTIVKDSRGPAILEIKTAGQWAANSEVWGPDGTDQVPEQYVCQVQYMLGITGYHTADLACLIGGQDFRIYHFQRDEEIIENLIRLASNFWQGVQSNTPPPPVNMDDARMRWSTSVPIEMTADENAMAAAKKLRESTETLDKAKAENEAAKLYLAKFMCNADTLLDGTGQKILTWKGDKNGKRAMRLAKGA